MFSYDTQMDYGRDAKYYLVAGAKRLLRLDDLPPEIRRTISKTHAPLSFAKTVYIPETDTLSW
jgi:hypothetical protein